MPTKRMKLKDLVADPKNPRWIRPENFEALKNIIKEFGNQQDIIYNETTGTIVGGHQRCLAMIELGFEEVDVRIINISAARQRAFNIALNNPRAQGEFVDDDVMELLKQIQAQDETLYEDLNLGELFDDLVSVDAYTRRKGQTDDDTVPEPPPEPVSKKGEIYVLGDHRLLCGDCTDDGAMNRVLEGEKARMVFTDPPWNVAIGQDTNPRHRQREGLQNDKVSDGEFKGFLTSFLTQMKNKFTGDLYCVFGTRFLCMLDMVLNVLGFHCSGTIMWAKDSFVLGRSNYHKKYEPIWYGWNKKGKSSYNGARDQDDIWEVPRPKRSEEHPTMKPVALVERAIENSSLEGDLVLEPFGGSGSTLIACETTGRKCRAIEIAPRYSDVIRQRWAEHKHGKGCDWPNLTPVI